MGWSGTYRCDANVPRVLLSGRGVLTDLCVMPLGEIDNPLREVPKGETMRGKESRPLHKWSSLEVSNNNSVMLVLLYSLTVLLLNVIVPEKVVSVRVL